MAECAVAPLSTQFPGGRASGAGRVPVGREHASDAGSVATSTEWAPLSKSAVSRLVNRLEESYERWYQRDLTEDRIVYLYLDAIYPRVRSAGKVVSLPVLVALGVKDTGEKVLTGISFLASRRLRGYTCLPPVWPSAHNIFPQMVPLAPFRPSGVLKTNALPASGSVFSDTAACRGSLRINFSAAKAELPRGHWQPSNPPHHRRKQPPCQMALRQQ